MPVPHVLLEMANGPPAGTEMPVNVSAVLSRLVTVTVFAALVLPTASEPKLRLVGGKRHRGSCRCRTRLTVCVPALSVIVRTPEAEPTTVGENTTEMVHEAAGAMLAAASVRLAERPGNRDIGHLQRARAGALHGDVARRAGGPDDLRRERERRRRDGRRRQSCPSRSAGASATGPRYRNCRVTLIVPEVVACRGRRERHRHGATCSPQPASPGSCWFARTGPLAATRQRR